MKKDGRRLVSRIRGKRIIAFTMALMLLLSSDAMSSAASASQDPAPSASEEQVEAVSAEDTGELKESAPPAEDADSESGGEETVNEPGENPDGAPEEAVPPADPAEETPAEEETPDEEPSAPEEDPDADPAEEETPDEPEENPDTDPAENEDPEEDPDEEPAGEETPDESEETPDGTPAGEEDPDESEETPDNGTAGEEDPDASKETPDGTPAETVTPEEEITPETPEEEMEETEEPEEDTKELEAPDLDPSMDPDEFEKLAEDEVGAATWDIGSASVYSMRRARARGTGDSVPFEFKINYVNKEDLNDVTLTDDFNLKYQMTFTVTGTDIGFEPGEIKIRIPKKLFSYRDNGGDVVPTEQQIALVKGDPENPDDGQGSGSTSFKYYEEDDDFVFYNCQTVLGGTNSVWQVLYKVPDIRKVVDGQKWTLQPEITATTVEVGMDGDGNFVVKEDAKRITYSTEEKDGATKLDPVAPLTGLVDTTVQITSITKEPYIAPNKTQYTPGLYTRAQVANYAGYSDADHLPQKFQDDFEDYRYVVWEVTVKGTATKPFNLVVSENPAVGDGPEGTQSGTEGILVGYRDNSKASIGYNIPVKPRDSFDSNEDVLAENYGTSESDPRSWGSRFYVVTAYPREAAPEEGTSLENTVTIKADPVDVGTDSAEETRTNKWNCRDYYWDYDGNIIYIDKNYDDGNNESGFSGWLDAYKTAKDQGKDYGDLPFSTSYSFRGYSWTHVVKTENGEPGSLIDGRKYRLIAADDVMYAWANESDNGTMLTGEDYYFSEVKVTPGYLDYDMFEDQEIVQDSSKGELKVYAMFKDETEWAEVTNGLVSSGDGTFSFNEELLAREPWRVKAEYIADAYRTTCVIDVKVRIRRDSPVMKELLVDQDVKSVRLEDISGVTGDFGTVDDDGNYVPGDMIYMPENTSDGGGSDTASGDGTAAADPNSKILKNYDGYNVNGKNDLEKITKELYSDGLIYRENDSKKLTGLTAKAGASKTSVSTNDSAGNRVVVDYCLTAYDGYEVYNSEAMDYLRQNTGLTPGQNEVVFYDLLPYGMKFDPSSPITAGRIKELDSRGNYTRQSGLWDPSQVSVTVDPEKDITANYNGTGRTRVAFHVRYNGADPTVYTNGMWLEGWGVKFSAWYDRKDVELIKKESNVCAFMPDNPEKSLVGKPNQEIFLDNNLAGSLENANLTEAQIKEYQFLGSDLNGDNDDDVKAERYNVMYADEVTDEDIAQAGQTGIEKTVIADADRFGKPGKSAEVEAGAGYTYEIRLDTTGDLLSKDLTVYDMLETEDGTQWQGEFQSVDVSSLERLGITAEVYYHERVSEGEAIELMEDANPDNVDENNGWILKETWEEENKSNSDVGAVAVKMEASGTAASTGGQNPSFRISMKAPADAEENAAAKNRSFYTTKDVNDRMQSNPTTVTIKPMETLTVTKTFDESVSAAMQNSAKNTSFEFELYKTVTDEKGTETEEKLAGQEYTVMENGEPKNDGLHATDGSGRFRLKPGQTAVFHLPNVEAIKVRETEQIFWEAAYKEEYPEGGEVQKAITMENSFRPVVYVRKLVEGVPKNEADYARDTDFIFKIETKDENGEYQPLKNKEFYYVDAVGTDGVVPGPDPNHGSTLAECRDSTDADGTFRLKVGEVAALCFDSPGIEYRITEVGDEFSGASEMSLSDLGSGISGLSDTFDIESGTVARMGVFDTKNKTSAIGSLPDTESGTLTRFKALGGALGGGGGSADSEKVSDWIYPDAQEGTTTVEGQKVEFTNIYRWKELYITKYLTHQDPKECDTPFTFQIFKIEKGENGEETEVYLKKEEIKRIECKVMTDLTSGNEEKVINIGEDGSFTCLCAGKTVRLTGLEAGVTYLVKEILEDGSDYRQIIPANDEGIRVTMPVYGIRSDISFTNDYLKRSLSVTKTLASAENVDPELSFPMTVEVGTDEENLKPLANTKYTLMKQGQETPIRSGMTDENGGFSLKPGETAVFEYVGKEGMYYRVTEEYEEGEEYSQVYPADNAPFEDVFGNEDVSVTFVNGDATNLYISKEYVYDPDDKAAAAYMERVEAGNGLLNPLTLSDQSTVDSRSSSSLPEQTNQEGAETIEKTRKAVKVRLYLNGERFKENCEVRLIDQEGKIWTDQWPSEFEDSVDSDIYLLEPGYTVVIPAAVLENYRNEAGEIAYVLEELEENQHRVETVSYVVSGILLGTTTQQNAIVEISQKYPENDAALSGTVEQNPVATIINEVKGYDVASERAKIMTEDSEVVPEGSRLVWRLEKYTASGWVPAENEPYVRLTQVEETVNYSDGSTKTGVKLVPVDEEIQRTGSDGRIVLTKVKDGVPVVDFLGNTKVYLNRVIAPAVGDLRLVEVLGESDAEWGMLAGYYSGVTQGVIPDLSRTYNSAPVSSKFVSGASSESAKDTSAEGTVVKTKAASRMGITNNVSSIIVDRDRYPLTVTDNQFTLAAGEVDPKVEYVAFVNSNKTIPVEIAKKMETSSDDTFTMILEQVLLLNNNDISALYKEDLSEISSGNILMSEARAGIPYEVYLIEETGNSSAGTEQKAPVRTGVTGANGEILLHAGEYARLELPEATLWTVHEEGKAGYELKDLTPESEDGRLQKLSENNMLIYQMPSRVPVWLDYDVVKRDIYYEDIQWDNKGNPSFDPLDGYIKVYAYYSDGTRKELSKDNLFIKISDGDLKDIIFAEGDNSGIYWDISWDGKTIMAGLTLNAVKKLTLTKEHVEKVGTLYSMEGIPLNLNSKNVDLPLLVRDENGTVCRIISIGEAFKENKTLETIKLPQGMPEVGGFYGCSNLKSVMIREGTTKIGEAAFHFCENLKTVNIPDGVITIGANAFANTALTEITIPSSVTEIGEDAFAGCGSLTRIIIKQPEGSLPEYTENWGCPNPDVQIIWKPESTGGSSDTGSMLQ